LNARPAAKGPRLRILGDIPYRGYESVACVLPRCNASGRRETQVAAV
jgi:hypothetical protein